MIFEKLLIPDRMFRNIYEITPDILAEYGIRAVICDIDNTLVTYDDPEPTEEVLVWFAALTKAGVRIAFVSNNNKERVDLFNKDLGYFASAKSGKPKTREIFNAMKHMKSSPEETALIGDQLLTDAAAGKSAGLTTFIVPPIKDKTTLFFRFKRLLEVPYIKKYKRMKENSNEK